MFDFGLGNTLLGLAGSVGGSALGLIGSLASSAASAKEARKTRKMQWKMWQEQKDMALHAHEYEVADLRRAGLNPILSATGGNGISVPSGSVSATPGGLDFSGAGDPVVKAFEMASALQKMELMQKQIEGVSSANEGKLLENEARRINNHVAQATSQFAIDEKAFGVKMAEQNLKKNAAELDVIVANSAFWKSRRGRNIFSAQEAQKAYPKSGTLGTILNMFNQGTTEASEALYKFGPNMYRRFIEDVQK